jgi:hypothetical protein
VFANGIAKEGDPLLPALRIDIPGSNYLLKNDLAILSIIAGDHWKRPICFTSEQDVSKLGLTKYLRSRGLVYELVPFENVKADKDASYRILMDQFAYGNADRPGIYYDEENRRRMNYIKQAHVTAALSLAGAGQPALARQVLERFDSHVREENFPYGMTTNLGNRHDLISAGFLEACYLARDFPLAAKVSHSLRKDLVELMEYYRSIGEENLSDEQMAREAYQLLQGRGSGLSDKQAGFASDILSSFQILRQMDEWKSKYSNPGISGQE